jgi:hypothetical protein
VIWLGAVRICETRNAAALEAPPTLFIVWGTTRLSPQDCEFATRPRQMIEETSAAEIKRWVAG